MTKSIDVACPAYCGAPYPCFRKKAINESKFEDGLRAKYWDAVIENDVGNIKWLSQEDEDPTTAWENEVKRAFAANGLKLGSTIRVKFGSRDTGYIHEYELAL